MSIEVGLRYCFTVRVEPSMSAAHLGNTGVNVLSTPWLIGLFEQAATYAIMPRYAPGEASVGTVVNIRHLRATALGNEVTVCGEVTDVDGRRVVFRVWAEENGVVVGEGTHERLVIDLQRFLRRLYPDAATGGADAGAAQVPIPVQALDHTAIAVRDVQQALGLYRDVLGGQPREFDERPDRGFRWLTLEYPNGSVVELLEPVGEAGFLQDFLAKRGEGPHHLTYVVSDLRASVEQLRALGLRVVDEDYADPAWQEAYISPRSAHGTVIQLAQTNLNPYQRRQHWSTDRYFKQAAQA